MKFTFIYKHHDYRLALGRVLHIMCNFSVPAECFVHIKPETPLLSIYLVTWRKLWRTTVTLGISLLPPVHALHLPSKSRSDNHT